MFIFGIISFIVTLLAAVVIFTINVVKTVQTNNQSKICEVDFRPRIKGMLIYSGIFAVAFTLCLLSIYPFANITPTPYELFATIFGGLLSGALMSVVLNAFLLHYYSNPNDENLDRWMFRAVAIGSPLLLIFVFLTTDGFAMYVKYPLINGISFTQGFVRPGEGTPTIAFYALCILSGAGYVYFLCDHKFYQEYGKHGILESTFIIALTGGILSARISYCIIQWNEFADNWIRVFYIWEGGLTIVGGAAGGILIGVLWFLWRNKKYSIWVAVDIIVPTILIAQAVGRWGNFFNTEVHGVATSLENWRWLPTFIWRNMQYGLQTGNYVGDGQVYVPLFLIEGLLNFLGYFVIAHLFGIKLRRITEFGDLAFGYFIWYGLVRSTLEPLRHESFIMNNLSSFYFTLLYVLLGCLAVVLNHLIRFFIAKKKNNYFVKAYTVKESVLGILLVFATSALLAIVGTLFLINSSYKADVHMNNFDIALIFYTVATGIFIGISIPISHLVNAKLEEKKGI